MDIVTNCPCAKCKKSLGKLSFRAARRLLSVKHKDALTSVLEFQPQEWNLAVIVHLASWGINPLP